ncbi:hypothetical protein [Maricaulis salignorans]|uniref:hypothetical protein n=1 Tax=Maricaulis salignorans TaxID=144026 RepID=UPI003A9480B2
MLPAASLFGARFSPDDLAAIRERAGTEGPASPMFFPKPSRIRSGDASKPA